MAPKKLAFIIARNELIGSSEESGVLKMELFALQERLWLRSYL